MDQDRTFITAKRNVALINRQLLSADYRPHLCLWITRITDPDRRQACNHGLYKGIMYACCCDQARGSGAALSR